MLGALQFFIPIAKNLQAENPLSLARGTFAGKAATL
jgi:hypothetical protein